MTITHWHVHRDGALWLVPAPNPLAAIDRAQPWALSLSIGEIGEAKEAGEAPREVSQLLQKDAPLPNLRDYSTHAYLRDMPVGVGGYVRVLRVLTLRDHVVVDSHPVRFAEVFDLARRLLSKLAEHDKQAPRRPMIAVYKSGKRKGQPRFASGHDLATRKQVLSQIAACDQHASERAYLVRRLVGTLEVLVHETRAGLPERLEVAAELRAMLAAFRNASLSWADLGGELFGAAKVWAREQTQALDRHIARLASVRDLGFAPGSRCIVQRSQYDRPGEDVPEGLAEVTGVRVDDRNTAVGRVPTHYREIRMLADGREWTVSTELLRPV